MELVNVSVENEMDLTLAYKKSIKAAELIGLSMSTQTAFATAVSEVCREVIDKTHDGLAIIYVGYTGERYHLGARITYTENLSMGKLEEGIQYAKKLVPVFNYTVLNGIGTVDLNISIPRSCKLNKEKIAEIKAFFEHIGPTTPYEELRQKNVELYQINEQSEMALRHAEYLIEKKNEFLTVASHELKTPLTILRAYTQMALKSECNETTLSHLKKVDMQALKLQAMMQQLLDISRIETGDADYNTEKVDFGGYIDDMADLIRKLIPEHHLAISAHHVPIAIDKLRIEQVIMNIAGNAAKYSDPGTAIHFSTSMATSGEILIAVKDQGIGMSPAELNKVFSKFYRVEDIAKSYSGLGMGLYISSKIIQGHGGRIWVESVKNEGSTFFFTLPLSTTAP